MKGKLRERRSARLSTARQWRKPILYCVVFLAVSVVMLGSVRYLWYLAHRGTRFSATVHTKAIAFELGENNSSGGIFNSGTGLVNITLQVPCHIADAIRPDKPWSAPTLTRLNNVKLQSMKMTNGLVVRLHVLDGDANSLRYKLMSESPSDDDGFAAVVLRKGGKVEYPLPPSWVPTVSENAELLINPDDHKVVEFTVTFLPDAASDSEKRTEQSAAKGFSNGRFLENDIKLKDKSRLIFADATSEIIPDTGSQIELPKRLSEILTGSYDRSGQDVIPVDMGLQVSALQDAVIHTLRFDPEKRSLDVSVEGKSMNISVANVEIGNLFLSGLLASIPGIIAFLSSAAVMVYSIVHIYKGVHDIHHDK